MIIIRKYKERQILATVIIIIVAGFVLYALSPYISAFAGALILFVLLYPINNYLRKKIGKKFSALVCVLLSILIVIAPLFFISNMLIHEASSATKNTELVNQILEKINTKVNIEQTVSEMVTYIKQGVTKTMNVFFGSVVKFFVSSIILYFTLFFLLISHDNFVKSIREHLPFNTKNSKILMTEFVNVTKSTVIGMGLIAIIQGILLGLGFFIFGIQGAVFWGFIGAVLSFLPVVGVTFIWVPVTLYQLFIGNYFVAIGFALFCGIIITSSDYLLRPYVSKKIARLHPLITLVGVFIGLPYFGVFGILVGPLLLSYLFLLIRMYGEEYLG